MTENLTKQAPIDARMGFVIESGIDLPQDADKGKGGRPPGPTTALLQAIASIEPLQSVLCLEYSAYWAATRRLALLSPKRFITRKVREGWRVWRTE